MKATHSLIDSTAIDAFPVGTTEGGLGQLAMKFPAIVESFRTRFPGVEFTVESPEAGHLAIRIPDIDFYCDSPGFAAFLDELVPTLSFAEYMALDFLTVLDPAALPSRRRGGVASSVGMSGVSPLLNHLGEGVIVGGFPALKTQSALAVFDSGAMAA